MQRHLSLRDVYVDASTTPIDDNVMTVIAADVFAFESRHVSFLLPKHGILRLYTRTITAPAPLNLDLSIEDDSGGVVEIFASVLDQPITLSCGHQKGISLKLGVGSGNVGARIKLSNGKMNIDYQQHYGNLRTHPKEFRTHLKTQLRIASLLFWGMPYVGVSLTAHVSRACVKGDAGSLLGAQADSLGKQLAAQILAGPDTSFAPVLQLEQYMNTLKAAIDAAAVYQTQYDRFVDRKLAIEDHMDAWKTMLGNSQSAASAQTMLRDTALAKYKSACDIVDKCMTGYNDDQKAISKAQDRFREGVDDWKKKKILQAVFEVLGAVISELNIQFFFNGLIRNVLTQLFFSVRGRHWCHLHGRCCSRRCSTSGGCTGCAGRSKSRRPCRPSSSHTQI